MRGVYVAEGGEYRAWTCRVDVDEDEAWDYMVDTSKFESVVYRYLEAHPESEQSGWPERGARDRQDDG